MQIKQQQYHRLLHHVCRLIIVRQAVVGVVFLRMQVQVLALSRRKGQRADAQDLTLRAHNVQARWTTPPTSPLPAIVE